MASLPLAGSIYTLTTWSGIGKIFGGTFSNAFSVYFAKIGAALRDSDVPSVLPLSYPIHTAVDSSGVKPTNQASELVVPVLPATGRFISPETLLPVPPVSKTLSMR
ncbi:hypothetical protein D3C75_1125050 [compost metagenome]